MKPEDVKLFAVFGKFSKIYHYVGPRGTMTWCRKWLKSGKDVIVYKKELLPRNLRLCNKCDPNYKISSGRIDFDELYPEDMD